MSLHVFEELHGHLPGTVTYYTQAACACGWSGEQLTGKEGQSYASTKDVIDDYRAHVEEHLGTDAYYDAPVKCRNCASVHEQPCLVGLTINFWTACTRCGLRELSPDNEAYNERERWLQQRRPFL